MTQNSAASSEAGDVVQKAAQPPGDDNKVKGTIIIKPPNPVDPDVVLQEGASEEEKAAWERFFAELEIWRQKRYERNVNWFRRDFPGQEPPPREDKNWARSIVMNHSTGILTGTGPPLPPGFPPGPTKEEIRERQRQEQPWLDRLAREWDAKVKQELEAEAGSDSP